MESKVNKFLKKNLKYIIFAIVLWIIGEMFLIAPIAYTISESYVDGKFDMALFIKDIVANIISFSSIAKVFAPNVIGAFGKGTLIYTIILIIALGIGMYKGRNKSEFQDIEHGSSDW